MVEASQAHHPSTLLNCKSSGRMLSNRKIPSYFFQPFHPRITPLQRCSLTLKALQFLAAKMSVTVSLGQGFLVLIYLLVRISLSFPVSNSPRTYLSPRIVETVNLSTQGTGLALAGFPTALREGYTISTERYIGAPLKRIRVPMINKPPKMVDMSLFFKVADGRTVVANENFRDVRGWSFRDMSRRHEPPLEGVAFDLSFLEVLPLEHAHDLVAASRQLDKFDSCNIERDEGDRYPTYMFVEYVTSKRWGPAVKYCKVSVDDRKVKFCGMLPFTAAEAALGKANATDLRATGEGPENS